MTRIRFSRVIDFCLDVLGISQTTSALAEKSKKDLAFFIRSQGCYKVLTKKVGNIRYMRKTSPWHIIIISHIKPLVNRNPLTWTLLHYKNTIETQLEAKGRDHGYLSFKNITDDQCSQFLITVTLTNSNCFQFPMIARIMGSQLYLKGFHFRCRFYSILFRMCN